MTEIIIQMLSALAIIVGAIILIGAAAKKKQESSGLMRVLAYQSFGQKKGIAAVQVGGEVILVGITPTDVKLLKSLDEKNPEQKTAPAPARPVGRVVTASRPQAPVADFGEKLRKLRSLKESLYAVK